MFNLFNKIAIVTGASRGIGKVIAQVFANAGAHVVCVARSEDAIASLTDEINSNGGSASYQSCDISDGDSFSSLISSVAKKNGRLDILVNNAGVTQDNLLMRMKENQWDSVLNINLKGAFHGMKAAIRPMMKNRNGRIINITSIVGLTGNAGQANYAASKAGLIGLSKSVAKEVATRGITVNCIAPGWIGTDMTDELSDDIKEQFLSRIPANRMGSPEDIAHAALFLASDEASYITGQTITVDGGRVIN
ncbi:MAG: 3-oxoacyl-[acyl-carrier-protein] reductase [Candidatus Marinimicrobia bacterium]|jgi:3-oxoacyl-[acyl-carrier protein] reductase|nr:3-oxoacyl-[acyl-carrier-protein] reductase [Candidatus Neomarinimicrobiota bacterium]MBT3500840.1 3-oxoacyl-[acyl-carrier-protein] reductase [Candidatus Neomarinimicrobiota bacterium]MBT3838874.1 3-oxoacyl-[acyl-carrier-protein] reductase [Candidatus Neomarinimicrobiota bacterium]MBT3998851.1 3-oxoacyl-[acyl-carrier-protein] reductase [Candidatus Neomarinimicrobiota bacterium]MBT4282830.1 3-oxoacyl-[acyl-carrier-protein] reductase [Candidatus Neomarinimicrobiota bacterium]